MIENVRCLGHSSILIEKCGKAIYIDPYDLKEENHNADIIFITHSHYDHYSEEDINKVKKENTYFVVTEDLYNNVVNLGIDSSRVIKVKPNEEYNVSGISFVTVPSYNINKQFHPKENGWVGYILDLEGKKYYIAGDTDITDENQKVICDVAFIPIGGTYTMTYDEAAKLVNIIRPQVAIPIHYGKIVGTKQDAENFKKLLDKEIECEILIK